MSHRVVIVGDLLPESERDPQQDRENVLHALAGSYPAVSWEWILPTDAGYNLPKSALNALLAAFRDKNRRPTAPTVIKLYCLNNRDANGLYRAGAEPILAPTELATASELLAWLASRASELIPGVAVEDVAAAVARARSDFADTLHIPESVAINTSLDGTFWYGVLRALHELCELERQGKATNKRNLVSDLLAKHVKKPKQTYKIADTGVFCVNPSTGKTIQLRERVHIVEGKPAETESIYWETFGEAQTSYRYLVGRIGRHT